VVITIVEWITVALNTETPVTVKSPLAFTGIEVSVVGSMFVSISPVTIVEVMSSECNWVSFVRLSFIAVMSTILVGTPAAVIWKVTTVVLGRVWLGVGFLKHSSVIWAMWFSVLLCLITVMSTILVGSPTAIVREVATVVLGRVWLSIGFFKHCSIIRAVWLPVGLLLDAIEVKRLLKMPLS